ncbi:multicopper oxidase domain-containing protein [Rhodanobacter sp. B2A1Ga4]|uniref:multicopper oxidase domain-containing protein n=1 Tax=Rhodanobacter TaxID=75309 RepID=UPI000D3BC71E|nr:MULTISPECIES: multicopper oxidase domain-containing protein [Rhodanobacter]MBQ4856047.1 multicopper oxidase domain-containing protein [Rhodanobacter sp. B2A1Ga4]
MSVPDSGKPAHSTWPAVAGTALRVAFGMIWAVSAALTWTADFASHYVGYLHNAATGQPAWSAWWFDMWIALVTPHVGLFVWATRIAETLLALALLLGFARKLTYIVGILFSLLIWSTAEGFGGPYSVGANNIGAAISYVLIFAALIVINLRAGPSPYSLDYLIERRWPGWRRVADWNDKLPLAEVPRLPWRVQGPALAGVLILVALLLAGLHSALNVRSSSPQAAAAAVTPLSLASSQPIEKARDARLPPLQPGDSVEVHITSSNDSVEIASGVQYQAWTFGKTVPGPVIHVRQGQTVNFTLTNRGTMQHSIDFHSAITPPSLHYVDIMPGESITFSFVARVPGAFLYHCGTPPVLLHIGNGMYGAIIVDPATPLPPAQESYVLVQGEWYTQQVSGKLMAGNYEKMQAMQPDEVVFNGAAFQYRDHPLTAKPGDRVRLYVVNAGPSLWSAFHVIGAIFDKVYPGGNPAQAIDGVSTYSVGPGEGAVFDLTLDEAGHYPFVDHAMAHMQLGAQGVLLVGGPNETAAKPPVSKAPVVAAPAAPPPAASGPYQFDPARGASLYATNCAACHQATGLGLPGAFPPLKDNPVVQDADPTKHIEVILKGLQGQVINGTSYPTAMPPFAAALNDADIADIANHERSSWGNQGKPVTAEQVKAVRGSAK